ncbi:MAG: phosphoribosylaminoimidazolesuccinocarboxamide synthase [Candidatus Paracaedibacteraceae bacterium]|nr:phosphoribosylaminoimidazolesuccinocarboxamide synthase [Candidatus Paracaedibacteraceae bacterium]
MATNFLSNLKGMFGSRRRQAVEGYRKTLYEMAESSGSYAMQFRDILNGADEPVPGKGSLNNRLSELFMSRLNDIGLETHFIRRLNMSEQQVKIADPYNFRVTVHNVACDALQARLGLSEHEVLPKPIVELALHDLSLNYPIIAPEHVDAMDWASADEVEDILVLSRRINDFICGQFFAVGFRLLNLDLEFGRVYQGDYFEQTKIILIDEITLDTCSVLDLQSGERIDGRSLQDKTPLEIAAHYQEVARRFRILGDVAPLDLNENFGVIEKE